MIIALNKTSKKPRWSFWRSWWRGIFITSTILQREPRHQGLLGPLRFWLDCVHVSWLFADLGRFLRKGKTKAQVETMEQELEQWRRELQDKIAARAARRQNETSVRVDIEGLSYVQREAIVVINDRSRATGWIDDGTAIYKALADVIAQGFVERVARDTYRLTHKGLVTLARIRRERDTLEREEVVSEGADA